MTLSFKSLLKKDLKLMISSKFFILALGSLILYSCYINFIYVDLDQDTYPVYVYDPQDRKDLSLNYVKEVNSRSKLEDLCEDGYSVGIDLSSNNPEIYMVSSGLNTTDNYRENWAKSILKNDNLNSEPKIVGLNSKEMKNRREITAEFLFFELSAVGFLGLASMLFKEKQMGVIRVHGILPVKKTAFVLSKLSLILASDLIFTILLTVINLGLNEGIKVLPNVLIQASILSMIMSLIGFFCAIRLPDFKQFSLFYLVLAIFITTPVFLAGQTNVTWSWINYHPMFHMFEAMKSAYFGVATYNILYYFLCVVAIILLFLTAQKTLSREMTREG